MAENKLPELGYSYNALEPFIDTKTMEIHHTKHHQGYIDKLNSALTNYPKLKEKSAEELIKSLDKVPEEIRNIVRNNGGGHVNHSFFWKIMMPKTGIEPKGAIIDAIKKTFGSFDKFKEEFANAGLNRFGSGWAWLVLNKGKLEIYSTANQDSPLMEGKIPLLGVDVWEHSYYLKYQNRRNEYLQSWWNVVNWKQVDENYKNSKKI